MDVKRAYDGVWRGGLLAKLFSMGIRGKMWRVIRAMLQKVERRVLVNGQLSEPFLAELGVPQGAVSSPFLYSCYINGVVRELHDRKLGWMFHGRRVPLLLYADDIVLIARSHRELADMMAVLARYALQWCFTFNAKKSNVVVVGKKSDRDVVKGMIWQLHGSRVEVSDTYKYLGVVLGFFGSRLAQALSSPGAACVQPPSRVSQQFALKFHRPAQGSVRAAVASAGPSL